MSEKLLGDWADRSPDATLRPIVPSDWLAPDIVVRRRDKARMRLIPAGTFTMGGGVLSHEAPARPVQLSHAYYMDETEVTVAEFQTFAQSVHRDPIADPPPLSERNPKWPMTSMSFQDAVDFATWVGCSLPTEAQWERAARAGGSTAYPWGDQDEVSKRNGRGTGDGFVKLAPVGSFPANAYGLVDMIGNAAEICLDTFALTYLVDLKDRATDPLRKEPSEMGRSIRGGSYATNSEASHVYSRNSMGESGGNFSVGWRCVHELRVDK